MTAADREGFLCASGESVPNGSATYFLVRVDGFCMAAEVRDVSSRLKVNEFLTIIL